LVDSGRAGAAGEPSALPTDPGTDGDRRGLVLKTDPNAPAQGTYADDYEILAPFE
jgi:hypothetical protein